MRAEFEAAKERMPSLGPTYRVHINRDGTVDGDFRVLMGPEYLKRFPILTKHMPWMRGVWLSVHDYWHPSVEDAFDLSDFLVHKGLLGQATYPVLWTKARVPTQAIIARVIAQRIEEGSGLEPIETVVHLRWDPSGKRPNHKNKRHTKGKS